MRQLARPPALVALDRALSRGGTSALDPAVPAELWRRALAGPAATFLARPGKQLRAALVRAGWTLAGGDPVAMPPRLSVALELLHAGSLIVDDVEDDGDERRGAPALHRVVGVPLAINTGSWMYFWALAELAELGLPGAERLAIAALVRCHQGQALDLATKIWDVDPAYAGGVVETVTRLKTGTLCQLAAELGAIAAAASEPARGAIARFAESAGCALQMLDDLGAICAPARRAKGREDLRAGRPTWPWAWLAECDAGAWLRLVEQARGQGDVDLLADSLAAEVGEVGRRAIRALLARTLEELEAALGHTGALDAVAGELARMEASYG